MVLALSPFGHHPAAWRNYSGRDNLSFEWIVSHVRSLEETGYDCVLIPGRGRVVDRPSTTTVPFEPVILATALAQRCSRLQFIAQISKPLMEEGKTRTRCTTVTTVTQGRVRVIRFDASLANSEGIKIFGNGDESEIESEVEAFTTSLDGSRAKRGDFTMIANLVPYVDESSEKAKLSASRLLRSTSAGTRIATGISLIGDPHQIVHMARWRQMALGLDGFVVYPPTLSMLDIFNRQVMPLLKPTLAGEGAPHLASER